MRSSRGDVAAGRGQSRLRRATVGKTGDRARGSDTGEKLGPRSWTMVGGRLGDVVGW
jgi:hypothetical protein